MGRENVFVYLVYGREDQALQAVYSILSLLAKAEDEPRIVVYTDRASSLRRVRERVEFVEISGEQAREWLGPHEYRRRMKPAVLNDFAERNPETDVALVDTDTIFVDDPALLFDLVSDGCRLHYIEDHLGSGASDKATRFRKIFKRDNRVPLNRHLWNTGAIVLPSSLYHCLPNMLSLCDYIFKESNSSFSEQLATSLALQDLNAEISDAEGILHHYDHDAGNKMQDSIAFLLESSENMTLPVLLNHVRDNPLQCPPRKREHRPIRELFCRLAWNLSKDKNA